jgi:hypothetical protein
MFFGYLRTKRRILLKFTFQDDRAIDCLGFLGVLFIKLLAHPVEYLKEVGFGSRELSKE